ncbi:hypothetical protein [Brevifollis gellanilyticus]|uniref:Uncharacterized protein n=1 Tax=Brevifollis gellanilyticus TaxID=748831 RepID=A0A512M2R0_9BACT|nr:hypothetical protein [Brevifollis gellanilyticus]GEP41025.1 hypothetical protein BGE01nite_03160 [Brevifollis gellanilyticus]
MSQSLSSIRRRAANNTLEVEHILGAAALRIEGLPELLDELARSEYWSDANHLPDGTHVVPLARWARVASEYCRNGMTGLRSVLGLPGHERFVLSLLEELHTSEAVEAMLDFFSDCIDSPAGDPQLANEIASRLNHILCFKPDVQIVDSTQKRLRIFASASVTIFDDDAKRAMAVCLLRAVGDQSSLELLATIPPFKYPWESVIPATKKGDS